jgi:hypothetical protein
MRRLLTGYAVSFNRRHRRSGHLFQNRYKSILCRENTYLLELVRYIHTVELARLLKLAQPTVSQSVGRRARIASGKQLS